MPQSSDERRAKMGEYFGDEVSDAGPTAFLIEQGYVLRRDWYWNAPDRIRTADDISEKENECLCFMIEEWDFGFVLIGDERKK